MGHAGHGNTLGDITPASPMSGSRLCNMCMSRSELMGHTIINKPVPGCQRGPPGWSLVLPRSNPGHQPLVSTGSDTPPRLTPLHRPRPQYLSLISCGYPGYIKDFTSNPPSAVAVMNPLVVQVTILKKFLKTKSLLLPTCPILFLFVD